MTESSFSLLKGLWEEGRSTPPLNGSNFVEGEQQDEENEEIRLHVQLVETRLLELVELQEQHFSGDDDDDATGQGGSGEDGIVVFDEPAADVVVLPIDSPHAYPCADTYKKLPAPPSQWPQSPLMLRPTPGSDMKIRGIRYADSTEYQTFPGVCAGCILPVNNGHELPGRSLVVDFESPLFVGTLLMRVAGAATVDAESEQSAASYFDGKNRKFQVVIKGRFRQGDIPVSECVTGQVFERAAGKLPARLIVAALVKFVSTLAPQLEAELDGDRPRLLTPLVATAQTVLAKDHVSTSTAAPFCVDETASALSDKLVNFSIYAGSATMEEQVEEPPSDDACSVMSMVRASSAAAGSGTSVVQRRAARKRAFNHVAVDKAAEPVFDPAKEYTFEFFQHLLLLTDPDDFKINMGGRIQVGLARSLNGQPIKILSVRRRKGDNMSIGQVLWSFDLWHQALYPYAKAALKKE